MDFEETPEESAFRAEARAGLTALVNGFAGDGDEIAVARAWQARLYDAGWAGITWPKEYGGRGGTGVQQTIFNEEAARAGAPVLGIFTIGLGMVGPTLMRHGTDAQKERYLAPMLRGDEVWCQLFSEPGAGSDLAGVRTRAERDGDEWVVNGQKVWTSGAHYREFGMLVARTNADASKHRGITCFVVDMRSAGVDARPLRQMNGAASFNEVFLTDVRLPADAVIGEVDRGWDIARTTLMHERVALGGGGGGVSDFRRLVSLAQERGRAGEPVVRQRLADVHIRAEVLRYLGLRMRTAASRGGAPGPEGSVAKLAASQLAQRVGDLALELQGPAGALDGADAPDGGRWQQQRLSAPSLRIAGGTDEIMRNIVGERVLGLPAEPRVDKDVPFRDAPG